MTHQIQIQQGEIPPTIQGVTHVYRMRCATCTHEGTWQPSATEARAEGLRHLIDAAL